MLYKKIISFVPVSDASVKGLMDFANGKDWRCGGKTRPGFKIRDDLLNQTGCYVFSILPIEGSVNRFFHVEMNGLVKCIVTFLKPWQYAVISGMINERGEDMPNYVISFDGKRAIIQEQKKFDFEEFKKKKNENLRRLAKTGIAPFSSDILLDKMKFAANEANEMSISKDN